MNVSIALKGTHETTVFVLQTRNRMVSMKTRNESEFCIFISFVIFCFKMICLPSLQLHVVVSCDAPKKYFIIVHDMTKPTK